MKRMVFVTYLLLMCAIAMGRGSSRPARTQDSTEVINLSFSFAPEDLTIIDKGDYSVISLKDVRNTPLPFGWPSLPMKMVRVLIPSGAIVTDIRVEGNEDLVAEGVTVMPVQHPRSPSLPKPAWIPPDSAVYASSSLTPALLGEYGQQGNHRGYDILTLRLNPVRYAPAPGELYLATTIEVAVTCVLPEKPGRVVGRNFHAFKDRVANTVVNPEAEPRFRPQQADRMMPAVKSDAPRSRRVRFRSNRTRGWIEVETPLSTDEDRSKSDTGGIGGEPGGSGGSDAPIASIPSDADYLI
ncbi:MAG: hypothetical protein GF344_00770, partial [Chitinivibrionales bacterium]|nr:hypothetical protein [Chitinivibrionales bacterium]MBD3355653.1 hypothetical protein [Chitinivibrionales bacterium]